MNLTALYMVFTFVLGWSSNNVSRAEFYPVFGSKSSEEMEKMIETLEKGEGQNAYLGALKMKLSGFQKGVNEKLETFKTGRDLLEGEIVKDQKNIEWRFLRLVIQENAPKILKYKANLEEDKTLIESNYSSATSDLKKTIKNYADNSEILITSELK